MPDTTTHRYRKKHKVLRVTGGKVAYTNTSAYPDKALDAALRALAKDLDIDGVVFHFKASGEGRRAGNAYQYLPSIMNHTGLPAYRWRYLAVVSDWGGWAETLHTLAHEAKHTDHYRHGTHRRGTKRKPNYGREAACDAFADWWLAKYSPAAAQWLAKAVA